MLYPKTRWTLRQSDENVVKELCEQLGISPTIAKLLANRGIYTPEAAQEFLYTEDEEFHSPFLLQDMDKTVQRINKAIEQQESILIFGDYDADGVTSTAVLLSALKNAGADVTYYIPNRFTEGYGPNKPA